MNGLKSRVIHRRDVQKRINPHLLETLPFRDQHESNVINPFCLLTPARFDVLAKYLYAKHWYMNMAMDWATMVYRDHLRVFGGLKEGDYSGKNTLMDFIDQFQTILKSIEENDFNQDESLIPVDKDEIIIDGSHRLAACLYHNKNLSTVLFDVHASRYDSQFFKNRGLLPDVADAMTLEYCEFSRNMRIAVIFPVAQGKDAEILNILEKNGEVVYQKEILFSEIGRYNLIRQIYRNEAWIGDFKSITPGLQYHVDKRFLRRLPVRFIFFICKDDKYVKEAKKYIRNLFDLNNDSIHINDTQEETIRIAQQILTANSIHFLNHAQPWKSTNFWNLFNKYKENIQRNNIDASQFCIDSGGVLASYGLRDTDDLDYLHAGQALNIFGEEKINEHNQELKYHNLELGDIVYDPRNHYYYDGMKFASLNIVQEMKDNRNEAKDIKDTILIESLNADSVLRIWKIKREIHFFIKKLYERIIHFQLWQIKKIIPRKFHPIARAIYRFPIYLKEILGPYEKHVFYKGFKLHYTKGTSIINRILTHNMYEQKLTQNIVKALVPIENPVFMDIGANIGLISLNVLSLLPNTKIYAFEPGPHQNSLLEKTIFDNDLNNHVFLIKKALSKSSGQEDFAIHKHKHASGDGLIDTGRAGVSTRAKVEATTLDLWWSSEKTPNIDVVKIDTEGAELWILQGAATFLKNCGPTIFLEINAENLESYPYGAEDIYIYLKECGYMLKTLEGNNITPENIREYLSETQDFIALPLKEDNDR